jgi:hypothetical protein
VKTSSEPLAVDVEDDTQKDEMNVGTPSTSTIDKDDMAASGNRPSKRAKKDDNGHYARSPNLRRALGKMLDGQGSRPALPCRKLKSNMRRASHASQITKMQDALTLRRVSPWLHTGAPGSQMRDEL